MLALIEELEVDLVSVDRRQAMIAAEALRRYGRSQHRAGLNFGDCFACALARQMSQPLLFKGDGFRHTDLRPALAE